MSATDPRSLQQQLRAQLERASAGVDTDRLLAALSARAREARLIDAAYDRLDSPLGPLLVAVTPAGVVRVAFDSEAEGRFMEELARGVSARVLRDRTLVDEARRQLAQYFEGRRRTFELELDWRLVLGFRRRVLRATARIPYGETRSYRHMAGAAGSPNAVRAAGSALANNPLPIIVPCHRVLRSDGGLGGYRGGLALKRRLLALERAGDAGVA
jgi:methylated-DNA-[protein]-cysteine S-methyltransferase